MAMLYFQYKKSIYELYDGGYNASSSAIIDFVNLGLAPSVDPSALHRDKLTISVSTDGASPKLTKSIMAELDALYPLFVITIAAFRCDSYQVLLFSAGKYIKSRYTNCMMGWCES
jgi:hypothetical protein